MVCVEIVTCFDYSSFLITDGVVAQENNLSNYNHEIAFTFILYIIRNGISKELVFSHQKKVCRVIGKKSKSV